MLVYAKKVEKELKDLFIDIAFDDFYMYEQNSTYRDVLKIPEDTWSGNYFASMHEKEIIGYLSYGINRSNNIVEYLNILHFGKKYPYTFGKDIITGIKDIFEKYDFSKINWSVTLGNPIEHTYDKLCKRYNGRIIGIQKKEVKLQDGKMYDKKLYEIMKEDYFSR